MSKRLLTSLWIAFEFNRKKRCLYQIVQEPYIIFRSYSKDIYAIYTRFLSQYWEQVLLFYLL